MLDFKWLFGVLFVLSGVNAAAFSIGVVESNDVASNSSVNTLPSQDIHENDALVFSLLQELQFIDLNREGGDLGGRDRVSEIVNLLRRHLEDGKAAEGTLRMLLQTCVDGDDYARPLSPGWEAKYRDILDAYYHSYEYCDDREFMLRDLPLNITVKAPELYTIDGFLPWPTVPTYMEVRIQTYWRVELEEYSVVRVSLYCGDEIVCAVQRGVFGTVYVPLPPLTQGEHDFVVQIDIGKLGVDNDLTATRRVTKRATVVIDDSSASRGVFAIDHEPDDAVRTSLMSECIVVLHPLYHDALEAGLYRIHLRCSDWEPVPTAVVAMLEVELDGNVLARSPVAIHPEGNHWFLGGSEVVALGRTLSKDHSFLRRLEVSLKSSWYVGNRAYFSLHGKQWPIWEGEAKVKVTVGDPITAY